METVANAFRLSLLAALTMAALAAVQVASAEDPYSDCRFLQGAGTLCMEQVQSSQSGGCAEGGSEFDRNGVAYYGRAVVHVTLYSNCSGEFAWDGASVDVYQGTLRRGAGVSLVEFGAPVNACYLFVYEYELGGDDVQVIREVPCPAGIPDPGWGHLPH